MDCESSEVLLSVCLIRQESILEEKQYGGHAVLMADNRLKRGGAETHMPGTTSTQNC